MNIYVLKVDNFELICEVVLRSSKQIVTLKFKYKALTKSLVTVLQTVVFKLIYTARQPHKFYIYDTAVKVEELYRLERGYCHSYIRNYSVRRPLLNECSHVWEKLHRHSPFYLLELEIIGN